MFRSLGCAFYTSKTCSLGPYTRGFSTSRGRSSYNETPPPVRCFVNFLGSTCNKHEARLLAWTSRNFAHNTFGTRGTNSGYAPLTFSGASCVFNSSCYKSGPNVATNGTPRASELSFPFGSFKNPVEAKRANNASNNGCSTSFRSLDVLHWSFAFAWPMNFFNNAFTRVPNAEHRYFFKVLPFYASF